MKRASQTHPQAASKMALRSVFTAGRHPARPGMNRNGCACNILNKNQMVSDLDAFNRALAKFFRVESRLYGHKPSRSQALKFTDFCGILRGLLVILAAGWGEPV